jgi:ABC-type molybdenum transport system ATPase subunit/photorepair protein PhrA
MVDKSIDAQGQAQTTLSSVIDLAQVSVRLGGRTILDQTSVSVQGGEFIAVPGSNGAGKSTFCC